MKSMLTQLTFWRNVSDVNMRRLPMNIAVAAVGALILATTPALAVGFEQAMVPDPDGPALETGIWYPRDAPASSQRLGRYTQSVAACGVVAANCFPLVAISPTTPGSLARHYDPALAPA